MNKKIISILSLAAVAAMAGCAAKATPLSLTGAAEAVAALDETTDVNVTKVVQVSKTNSRLNQALYVGYEDLFLQQIGYSVAAADTYTESVNTCTKYENNTLVTHEVSKQYYQDDLTTPVDSYESETIIYLTAEGSYVMCTYYGEGDPNNFAIGYDAEWAEAFGYESFEEFFQTSGYGAVKDVQYYVPAYVEANAECEGTKNKDGSFKFRLTVTATGVVTDIVRFQTAPSYTPATIVEEYIEVAVDKEGYVTSFEQGTTYYLTGSILDGSTYEEPVVLYETSLLNHEYSKTSNGDYTGSYHTEVEI